MTELWLSDTSEYINLHFKFLCQELPEFTEIRLRSARLSIDGHIARMAFVPSPEKPVIAVAGSTGDLGTRLINTFLSQELRDRLSGVVALARQHTPTTNKWSTTGAQIRTIDDTSDEDALITALDGVDVLVNA